MEPQEENIVCLNCGYDLRGTPGNVCSECGKPFDRDFSRHSLLPWERVGSFKFLRTVSKVIFGKKMSFEAFRDHDLKKARRFRRRALALIILALVLGHLVLSEAFHAEKFDPGELLIVQGGHNLIKSDVNSPSIGYDLLLILGLGFQGSFGWLLPLAILPMLARDWFYGLGNAMKNKKASAQDNERAESLGCYLASHVFLALLLLAAGFCFQLPRIFAEISGLRGMTDASMSVFLRRFTTLSSGDSPIPIIVSIVLGLGALWIILLAVLRMDQWRRGIYGAEKFRSFPTLGKLLWVYLWRAFFWVLWVPFFAGFVRLCYRGLFVW